MKSFFDLRENKQVTEAVRVSRKDFDKLKKGSMITIDYGSSIKGSTKRTFMVKGKSRSAKYNVDKINMVDPQKPGGMKFHLYSRNGEDATLALGDMGATINSYSIKEAALKTSDYPKGTSMSAQKFKDSQKKMSKQRALTTKDYPKGTSMSATAWKNKQEEVELDEAPKVPDGMKFLGAYEYKDANGKYHSHRHYSKGGKMNSPVVVYIDDKEWETFQSFTKARKAAINHIKGMKESVEEAKVRGADAYDKTFANRKQADKFAREMGGRVKQVGRVFYVFKEDVDEATILRTKTTRKQSDASKEKDKEKAVKTFQDIRKGKYPGVKIGEATMADKEGPGKGKDMRDMSKLDHAKARDWHQYKVKSKGDYHSKMAKIHHANAIGGSSMLHKEDLDEASIQDIQGILTTIAKSQNMNQAVQMVVKKYKVDQGKAKAMVKKAIDSGVTYDKIKKKYAKEEVELDELSMDLKKRYVDKAKDSKDRHRKIAKDYATRSDKDAWTDKMSKSHARSANNRVKGIQRATEATYQGKKVPLNKPMAGDVKKSKVYVDPDGDGVAKKVNFGDKNMTIKKNIPARRKSFRARHNCDNPGPKDKARYWSCKAW